MHCTRADAGAQMPALDAPAIRKMVLRLEKSVNKNEAMRCQHAHEPVVCLPSEADLHQQIKAFHALSMVPSLYAQLVDMGVMSTLIALLGHENTDIGDAVVELLKELTEEVEDADSDADDAADPDAAPLRALCEHLVRRGRRARSTADAYAHRWTTRSWTAWFRTWCA